MFHVQGWCCRCRGEAKFADCLGLSPPQDISSFIAKHEKFPQRLQTLKEFHRRAISDFRIKITIDNYLISKAMGQWVSGWIALPTSP